MFDDDGCPIEKDGCRICYESIAITTERGVVMPCRHSDFHVKCLQEWRQACNGQSRCPCCNGAFTEVYAHRIVAPGENVGPQRPVSYCEKLYWTFTQAERMPSWYPAYMVLLGASIIGLSRGAEEPSLGFMVMLNNFTGLAVMCALIIHLSVGPVLYDYEHGSIASWQLQMVLSFPLLLVFGAGVMSGGGSPITILAMTFTMFVYLGISHDYPFVK